MNSNGRWISGYIFLTKHRWTDVGKIQHILLSQEFTLHLLYLIVCQVCSPISLGSCWITRCDVVLFLASGRPPPVAKDYRSGLPLTPLLKDLSSSSTVGSIKRSSWCRLENHFPSRNWRGVEETLSATVKRMIKFLVLWRGTSFNQRN